MKDKEVCTWCGSAFVPSYPLQKECTNCEGKAAASAMEFLDNIEQEENNASCCRSFSPNPK